MANSDEEYLNIIVNAIQVCSHYKPKLGRGEGRGYSLEEFQGLYQADSFYNWFGLDNSLMYAAHKAAGGMTSIYRQIGIGGEHLFRKILQDQLNLSETDSTWSYEIPVLGRSRKRKLSLDGRIPLDMIQDIDVRNRIWEWIRDRQLSWMLTITCQTLCPVLFLKYDKVIKARIRRDKMPIFTPQQLILKLIFRVLLCYHLRLTRI